MLDIENSADLLHRLQDDKQSADNHKATWDDKREVWIREGNGDAYGNEVKGKSTLVSRDIKKSEVWQHATIIDPFVSNADMVRASAISAEDGPYADQSETLLNHFFCRSFDRYNYVSEGFKILQREGTVIARVGWEFEEREVEVEVPVTQMTQVMSPQGPVMQPQAVGYRKELQMKTVLNRPTAANRDNRTLWIDPTEKQNISKAQFVVEHFKSSISELTVEGIYENLDQIEVARDESYDDDDTYDDSSDESFSFKDKARAELDVYEYWGNYDVNDDGIAEAIVCTWVGNTITRLEENPYPDQQVPYISAANDPEPFSIRGRPNADLQSSDQKINTSIVRSLMDTLDSSTNGQRGFKEGTLDPANERKFKAKKDFKYQGSTPEIWEGKYADFNPSVLQFYELTKQNQAELTGIRPFAGGQGGSLGSASEAKMAMGAVAKKEVDISRNFAENFIVPLLRKWLSMINEFMEPEEIERITGKPYVKPDMLDPTGSIDIRIEVSTAETDAVKAQDINFMLQTNGPSLTFEMRQLLMQEQAELKKMPELAKKIEAMEPPKPDPLEQQLKMLEIELKKAEIAERNSRAQENQVDMKLKEANTILAQAKARELHGKADQGDLDFTRKASGQEQQDAIQIENVKSRNKMLEEREKPTKGAQS